MANKNIPSTEVSPKVWVSLASIIGVGVLSGLLENLNVDLFSSLGEWAPVVFGIVTAIISGGLMWLKRDQLRESGAVIRGAHGKDGQPLQTVDNVDGSTAVERKDESPPM